MRDGWKEVMLRELVTPAPCAIPVEDEQVYKQVTVALHGRGLRLRGLVLGRSIKTKRQCVIREGQLVYSRIDARNGAIGIVPPSLDGAIVTGDFPVFNIDQKVIHPRFLELLITTRSFEDACRTASRGVTNRQRLREAAFLDLTVQIPTEVGQQQRILRQLESILCRLDDAASRSTELEREIDSLLLASYQRITTGVGTVPFSHAAALCRRKIVVQPDAAYPELGVRSFGKGTFHKPALTGTQLGGKRIYGIEPGDLVFNNVFAWEGAVAVAGAEDKGRVGSHRFITFVPRPDRVSAHFLCYHFLTQKGLEDLGKASPGSAGRNRTLGLKSLARIEVPVPPLEDQLWFEELMVRRMKIAKIREQAAALYAAFMPALLAKAFRGEL